jgi:hypothetical protein
LDEAVLEALMDHADVAHLPVSVAHVRAQAAVAVRAAQEWSMKASVTPMPNLHIPTPQKPVPHPTDLPPDHPTDPGVCCARKDCSSTQPAIGWRWYVADGWHPVCSRHMAGATQLGRRHNTQYEAGAA